VIDEPTDTSTVASTEPPSLEAVTRFRVAVISIVAVVLLSAGVVVAVVGDRGSDGPDAFVELARPLELPAVVLTDTTGAPYDLRAEGEGVVTLLYFGYLSCPDVCPIHMAVLGATFGSLPTSIRERLRVVFVTTDPDRDDPVAIRNYLDRFDESFVGLTGSADALREAQVAAGVPVAVIEPVDEDGDYLVGHATQVLVFESDGVARRVYPFGVRQSDWLDDLVDLVERGTS
jgi:protein SCO1/2